MLAKMQAALDATESGVYEPDRIVFSGGDSLRPADVVNAPGNISHNPPKCPRCATLLYPMSSNPVGDTHFQCLNGVGMNLCGYETIYRVQTRTWEQFPNRHVDDWVAPGRQFNRQPVTASNTPPPVEAPEGLLTVRQAAERLGLDPHVIAALITDGKMSTVKHEGKTYIDAETITALEYERAASATHV